MEDRVTVAPATVAHAVELAPLMREADVAELEAMGVTPLVALLESVEHSTVASTVWFHGEIACMYGAAPVPADNEDVPRGTALAWLLTTDAVSRHPKDFLRTSKRVVEGLLDRYPVLCNVIDARYEGAVRWARWLGFEVGEPAPFGPHRQHFHPITLRRSTWAQR